MQQQDPFAAIADKHPANADPFASIAESPASAPPAKNPPPTLGPLDQFAQWGASLIPHMSRADVQKPENQQWDTAREHPELFRDVSNASGAMLSTITATPAAIVNWFTKGPWTPGQSAKEIQDRGASGTPYDPKKPISSETVHDYAAEKVGQAAGAVAVGEAGGAVLGTVGPATRALKGKLLKTVSGVGPEVTQGLVKATADANKVAVEKTAAENAKAAQDHYTKTLDAIHETKGNELQYQQAVTNAKSAAADAQKTLDAEHAEAVQKALHDTREKEDLYQNDLRKAKEESEQAYQAKLADVEKKRKAAQDARGKELRDYAQKKAKVQQDYADAQAKYASDKAKQGNITPTADKLRDASSELRGRVETARESALKEGNAKYNALSPEMNPLPLDSDTVHNLYLKAADSIGDVQAQPPILSRLGKSIEDGDKLTYKDAQGMYTELGRELSKGTLPPATYHAYDLLHEGVGQEMYRIANSQGDAITDASVPKKVVDGKVTEEPAYKTTKGKELYDSRNYWRRMKQTFGKPLTLADNATAAIKGANPDFVPEDVQANRVRLLGSFDPSLPGLFEHVQNLQKGAEALPKPVPARTLVSKLAEAKKPLPPVPGAPEPVADPAPITPKDVPAPPRADIPDRPSVVEPKMPEQPKRVAPPDRPETKNPPNLKKISDEDIRTAKADAIAKRSDAIRNRGGTWANTFVVLDAIRNAVHGNIAGIAEDAAVRAIFGGAKVTLANMLERPDVVKFLTEPTAKDIAQIPPELRGDIKPIVEAAKAHGIKVSPLVTAAALGGPKTQQLQKLRDEDTSNPQ